MRVFAERFADRDPELCACHGVDAGDMLAFATRFDRQWAYRGGQALLWSRRVTVHGVLDRYLPLSPLRPLDRRGILQLEASVGEHRIAVVATQFAEERIARAAELRYVRSFLRALSAPVVFFASGSPEASFGSGLRQLCAEGNVSVSASTAMPLDARAVIV